MHSKKIWLNGKFIGWNNAKIHILNHTLHYGSGAFEGIRAYKTSNNTAVFRLDEHINRLFYSASVLEMKIPYSKKTIKQAVLKLIKINNLKECYIRPIVFYGEKMGLMPIGAPFNIAIIAWPWERYLEKERVSVKISKFMRIHPKSSIMSAKLSGHYLNSIISSIQAKKSGFDEALLLDNNGNIAEGPGENIFFVKNKTLYTPKLGAILPGITRQTIISIAKDLKYKIKEKNIKPLEIKFFDEAFFCGTAIEVCPIKKINRIIFKKDIVSKQIQKIYLDIVHGKTRKYEKWLTIVK